MIVDYWISTLKLSSLYNYNGQSLSFYQKLHRREIDDAKITNDKLIKLLAERDDHDSHFVLAEQVYIHQESGAIFSPYFLIVKVDNIGEIHPVLRFSLPIFPWQNLEGNTDCQISLGCPDDFCQYFYYTAPLWQEDENLLSLEEMRKYARTMLLNLTKGVWQASASQAGYIQQDNAIIFPITKVFDESTKWQYSILCNQLPQIDDEEFLKKLKNSVTPIKAMRACGKSKYAKKLITDSWILSAFNQDNVPQDVWIKGSDFVRHANIFEAVDDDLLFLNKKTRLKIVEDENFSFSFCIQDFLSTISHEFNQDITSLTCAKDKLVAKQKEQFLAYQSGLKLVYELVEIQKDLSAKYHEYGGLDTRLLDLQQQAKETVAQLKHQKVLEDVFARQLLLVPKLPKILTYIPFIDRLRLKKVIKFCKQHFSAQDLGHMSEFELTLAVKRKTKSLSLQAASLTNILKSAEESKEKLNKLESACLEWYEKNIDSKIINLELDKFKINLKHKLYPDLLQTTIRYYELELLDNISWKNSDSVNLLSTNEYPDKITTLIVEHSENMPVTLGATLLLISETAVIMGTPEFVYNNTIPQALDFYLADFHQLAYSQDEFAELVESGITASSNCTWNLVSTNDDMELSLLSSGEKQFELIGIKGYSENHLGSLQNIPEIRALKLWLKTNSNHYDFNDDKILAIYTPHKAQYTLIKNLIDELGFKINVYILQKSNNARTNLSILLPTYTKNVPGPYIFDKGDQIFTNLIANTKQKVLVIGDKDLFSSNLHSPSGKFAKNFIIPELSVQVE